MEATKEEKMEQVHEYGDIEGEVLMSRSIVFKEPIPIVEKRWLQNNTRLTSAVNGQTCIVVIDGGSSDIISHIFLDRSQALLPAFCPLVNEATKCKCDMHVSLLFTIGGDHTDMVWYNVLSMDSGDSLLRRSWMYNNNGIYWMKDNTYLFVHNEKPITLHRMKPEPPKKGSRVGVAKEVLQVCHVYRGNADRTLV